MNTNRQKLNELRLERYNKYWQDLENPGHGESVSTPREYLVRINNHSISDQHSDLLEIDQTTSRHSLARFYPYNEQPILFALEEPRLDDFETNERKQLAQSECDPDSMSKISVNYYGNYLAGKNGHDTIFKEGILEKFIQSDSPIGPDEGQSTQDYLHSSDDQKYDDRIEQNISTTSGVWKDFYVTNTFLLDDFSEFRYNKGRVNRKTHRVEFFKEIQQTSSKIVILSGSEAWKAVKSGIKKEVGPIKDELSLISHPDEMHPEKLFSSNVTEIQGCLYKDTNGRFYIPVPHIGGQGKDRWENNVLKEAINESTSQVW